jgi:hypothetical protein
MKKNIMFIIVMVILSIPVFSQVSEIEINNFENDLLSLKATVASVVEPTLQQQVFIDSIQMAISNYEDILSMMKEGNDEFNDQMCRTMRLTIQNYNTLIKQVTSQ